MDFRYHYSDDQKRFRREVRSLLDRYLASEPTNPPDVPSSADSLVAILGQQGWLDASLDSDRKVVLLQELERVGLRQMVQQAVGILDVVDAHGLPDRRRMFLADIASGRLICWMPSASSEGAVDPTRTPVEALRDGDDYILDGSDLFSGPTAGVGAEARINVLPDFLWVQAVSGPEGPSPMVSVFLIPAALDGVSVSMPRRLNTGSDWLLTFDKVRVPPHCLLGSEDDGWMLGSLLRSEELEPLPPLPEDEALAQLLDYASETRHMDVEAGWWRDAKHESLASEPNYQQLLVEACINSRLAALFRTRDAWMKETGRELTYHGAQTRELERRTAHRMAEIARQVAGMYALLDADDPRAPAGGGFERMQRLAVADTPPESAVAGDLAIIASALGLGSGPKEVASNSQDWQDYQELHPRQEDVEMTAPAR